MLSLLEKVVKQDISTHALTEGDATSFQDMNFSYISTHALTEGDDVSKIFSTPPEISTHALTEGDCYTKRGAMIQ